MESSDEGSAADTPIDGFTPDQRFFIGLAQWACENQRPESERLHALTDPHSPGKYRDQRRGGEHAGVPESILVQGGTADGERESLSGLVNRR